MEGNRIILRNEQECMRIPIWSFTYRESKTQPSNGGEMVLSLRDDQGHLLKKQKVKMPKDFFSLPQHCQSGIYYLQIEEEHVKPLEDKLFLEVDAKERKVDWIRGIFYEEGSPQKVDRICLYGKKEPGMENCQEGELALRIYFEAEEVEKEAPKEEKTSQQDEEESSKDVEEAETKWDDTMTTKEDLEENIEDSSKNKQKVSKEKEDKKKEGKKNFQPQNNILQVAKGKKVVPLTGEPRHFSWMYLLVGSGVIFVLALKNSKFK